jgi:hypothetical protein
VSTVATPTAPRQPQPPNQNPQNQTDVCGKSLMPSAQLSVKATHAQYSTAATYTSNKFFITGQSADMVLSAIDFDDTGGGLLFNHPSGVASDGARLVLVDRNNNRVLVWRTAPTSNTAPDFALGQPSLTTNNPGKTLSQMNWPSTASAAKNKLVVADTENHRVLIWHSFPTKSGQAADAAVDFKQLGAALRLNLSWPWGVWTDGEKLLATSTSPTAALLIWNKLPTTGNETPDVVVRDPSFGTPRYITSDGKRLMVWDHNLNGSPQSGSGAQLVTTHGTLFWNALPTKGDAKSDFISTRTYVGGAFTSDGKLIAAGEELAIWNSFPTSAAAVQKPDLVAHGANVRMGDSLGVAVTSNGRVYVVEGNANKLIAYHALPTRGDQKPDFVVGSSDLCVNTLDENFIITNPVPASNGKNLFVSSDFDRKLYVWKALPNQSNAYPDFVYALPGQVGSMALWKDTLVLAGEQTVLLWKKLPLNGELPDVTLNKTIGNVTVQKISGVALDDKFFYLADDPAGKIYVWSGFPTAASNPALTLDVGNAINQLKSDGKYFVFTNERVIKLFKVAELKVGAQPLVVKSTGKAQFNLLGGAITIGERLLLADTVNGRVFGWEAVSDAVAGKDPTLILGATDFNDTQPEIGRDKLYWPKFLNFDGAYLWVGEFKFSVRLLRFALPK